LFAAITPPKVVWVSRRFAALTDQQWDDAFRAAGYEANLQNQFIATLESNIQEGLAVDARAADTP
jgi:hypothetical protein